MTVATQANPLLSLDYVPALESIGDDYYDEVAAADFPQTLLRFRNDAVLQRLGLDPTAVSDDHFVEAFGQFQGRSPFLALRYHGYQFGAYNAFLGDGRGFLYGQVIGQDDHLYDFGTKGSGTTPYSRGGDGRLTLKGGVREVLAAEALHALGVRTSRTLSMIETGEQLFRGDEPSPTRSAVMVRFSRSHIRFGTFERLDYLDRTDLIQRLLEHVIEYYYPAAQSVSDRDERYLQFYRELVERTAELAAQWMSVGFCHAVLNTDNMSITGESFDYGPYAFFDQYDPKFTAAYFDYSSRYCYRNQPAICQLNLRMLQKPLKRVIPETEMTSILDQFEDKYWQFYSQRMLHKLGFESLPEPLASDLINQTLDLLNSVMVGYHDFFRSLAGQFSPDWANDDVTIFDTTMQASDAGAQVLLEQWRQHYRQALKTQSADELAQMSQRLRQTNPQTVLLRPEIEAIWEPIVVENDWEPFYALLQRVQHPFAAS
ncbi:MAG: YdiU family protein [Leptolyngbya sp. SIOISBB]|nr:YdiU family protein [Leptolyngbya sp. SIOISBB]